MARRPHFTVAGIPVRVEPAFFLVIALLGIDPRRPEPVFIATWVVLAFVSVLVHELGHALAFRRFGVAPQVTLHGLGGLTSGEGHLTPARHIVVSLAGPLAALVLLGLPAWWLDVSGLVGGDVEVVVAQAMWINIGWSLLNLAPVLPLDGGQVLASVVDVVAGGRGQRVAQVVSVAVAVALGLWALWAGLFVGVLLAGMFAALNLGGLRGQRHQEVGARLDDAQRLLLAHRPVEAEAVARAALARRPTGPTRRWATELVAWTRLWQGDQAGAAEVAATVEAPRAPGPGGVPGLAAAGPPGPSASFRAAQALAAGRTAEGVATLAWAFTHDPPGPAKALGAVAAAGSGQARAVGAELVLLGPDGVAAARLLAQLLDHTGYRAEAAAVVALTALRPPTA